MKHTNYKKNAISAAIGLSLFVGSASAQELEVITISANKRVESLQDVAISVIALSGDDIADSGATDFESLSDAIPNVDISAAPGIRKISIRGLGSGSGNPAFEQSVGLYIDGIYASRVDLFQEPFLDVERLEVLKGPQGVLFGKNSIAGALAIHSAKPQDTFVGRISAGYEFEYGSYDLTAMLTGPLTDDLSGRLVVKHSSTEGYLDNASTGPDGVGSEATTVRGSLLWDAGENTQIYLKVESSDILQTGSPFQAVADKSPGTLPALLDATPRGVLGPEGGITEGFYRDAAAAGEDFIFDGISYSNENTMVDQQTDSVTFQVTHMIGEHELVYLAGLAGFDNSSIVDNDFSASPGIATESVRDFSQTSHELRIVSPKGETIEFIAGIYYLDRELDIDFSTHAFGNIPPLTASTLAAFDEDTTSKAIFAQVTWNIADNFKTSLGARYSKEEKTARNAETRLVFRTTDLFSVVNPPIDALLTSLFGDGTWDYERSISEDSFDPSFTAQWDINSDTMSYFTWTKATKAGGFDASEGFNNPDVFIYQPEEATGFEVGIKMDLLDGSARLNTAIFRTDFDDLQVSSYDPTANGTGSFVTTNAGKAISQGIEIDGLLALSDNLTIGANIAYLSSEYDDFFTACAANPVEAAKLNCEMVDGVSQLDLSGFQTESAPKLTGSIFAEYFTTFGEINAQTRINLTHKGETALDPSQDSHLIEDAYTKVNVNFTLTSEDETWALDLGVFNLTDEQPSTYGGQAAFLPGVYWKNIGRGREVKANVSYKFE